MEVSGDAEVRAVLADLEAYAEVRMTSETGGQKGVKPARVDQIPADVLLLLAERYGNGNAKYPTEPGGLDNWRKGYPWSQSYAAMMRHALKFWAGEDRDPDTGEFHTIAVAWHALTMTKWQLDGNMARFDDRQDARSAEQVIADV